MSEIKIKHSNTVILYITHTSIAMFISIFLSLFVSKYFSVIVYLFCLHTCKFNKQVFAYTICNTSRL